MIEAQQSNELSRATRMLGLILIISGIIFSPFYFFPSGSLQPAHVIMLCSCSAIITLNPTFCTNYLKQNKGAWRFLLLTMVINLFYASVFQDSSFLLSAAHWLYSFTLLIALVRIASDKIIITWVTRLILLAFMFVVLAFLFGYGNYPYMMRYSYFFNGPNQLTYFVICMFTLYLGVSQARTDIWFHAVLAFTTFIIFSTGGRSGYFSLLPIFFIGLWLTRRSIKNFIAVLIIPFVIGFLFQSACLPMYAVLDGTNTYVGCEGAAKVENRSALDNTINRTVDLGFEKDESDNSSLWTQLKARGYFRLIEYPKYILYGAGQGLEFRFSQTNGFSYEIHSSPVALLFYYGFVGFLLFIFFIVNSFKSKKNLIFLLPIFVYSLFTYGLRAPYFWFVLAFFSVSQNLLFTPQDDTQT